MKAPWRPKAYWVPRKPKLMFQICQKVSAGLRVFLLCVAGASVVVIYRSSTVKVRAGAAAGRVECAGKGGEIRFHPYQLNLMFSIR